MIILIDDGTLDTVFRCTVCNEEIRCNYDPYDELDDDSPEVQEQSYLDWHEHMQSEIAEEHECKEY